MTGERITRESEIQSVMTLCPHTVRIEQSIAAAREMMEEHGCRHLPVVADHEIVGIISHRDIQFALGWAKSSAAELDIRDVYIPEPFIVAPTAPLIGVIDRMGRDHIGCAIVAIEKRVVGIITTTDVCRLFTEHFR